MPLVSFNPTVPAGRFTVTPGFPMKRRAQRSHLYSRSTSRTPKLTWTKDFALPAPVRKWEGKILRVSHCTLNPSDCGLGLPAASPPPFPRHVWAGWASSGARCLLHREAIYELWVFCLFT
uniref:Uncharacterized protein n=1 Tax=Mustela putorius furo TaxID=9669 RepID=M3YR40_MUSPF